jgi:hypothetical protein
MKNVYRGYLRLTNGELDGLWRDGLIVPDANILLNLYRYSDKTRIELLTLFRGLRDRIWLPHQAGLEFHRNRLGLIADESAKYQQMLDTVAELLASLDQTRGHPYVSTGLRKVLAGVQKKLAKEVKLNLQYFAGLHDKDPILDELHELFSSRVGDAPSDADLAVIRKEGEDRYKRQVPPGFEDGKKPEATRYGDLIIWKQILKKAAAEPRPVILVSDDRKEDWLWRVKGRTIGPLPALREEFFATIGKHFHMYESDRFMERAGNFLNRRVERKAIDEAKATREQDLSRSVTEGARIAYRNALLSGTNPGLTSVVPDYYTRLAGLSLPPGIGLGDLSAIGTRLALEQEGRQRLSSILGLGGVGGGIPMPPMPPLPRAASPPPEAEKPSSKDKASEGTQKE